MITDICLHVQLCILFLNNLGWIFNNGQKCYFVREYIPLYLKASLLFGFKMYQEGKVKLQKKTFSDVGESTRLRERKEEITPSQIEHD